MTKEELANLTDEEFANLSDEEVDKISGDVNALKMHGMLARAFLSHDILNGFGRPLTDIELATPPFRDETERRYRSLGHVIHRATTNLADDRFRRLLDNSDIWKTIGSAAGRVATLRLLIRLIAAKEWYDKLCRTHRLRKDEKVAQIATELRARLREHEWEHRLLLEDLGRFVQTRKDPPDEAWLLLPHQQRETAFRTFVIRFIANYLANYMSKPPIHLIAELTTATLPDGPNFVTDQHVRTALGL